MMLAVREGRPRRSALQRTERIALRDTTIDGHAVHSGTRVTVDLTALAFEFGAGPHRCPGQILATSIATAIVSTVQGSSYRPDLDALRRDPDGHPVAMPMHPTTTT